MTGARPSPPGPLPERLGRRFVLGELIGRGTCSEVYRAHDMLLDRAAAVKIFPVADDPRIQREVSLMASLDHPNLVPVYDVGRDAGRAFVVMSLLEGGNLVDRLADGPLGVTETLLAVAAVADALGHVHRAGVLHRDVTPRNVLFDGDDRAHLSDFGVAFIADAPRITDTGIVVGSAPYLAPEQVRGDAVGTPADVYALGLVMIEALTGRPAYDGTPLVAARARLERRPDIPAGLDAEIVALLEAMTADDPADRPAADQVCVGLRRAALAAETVTPLEAVVPVADAGLGFPAPDPATDALSGTGVAGRAAAGAVDASGVGLPAPDPLDSPTGETPQRRRPMVAEAGGLAVAASVVAAALLAGGVVVASAWTVDGISASAPPAATLAPPSAEVALGPEAGVGRLGAGGAGGSGGSGATSEPVSGGEDEDEDEDHARPVVSRAEAAGSSSGSSTDASGTDGGSATSWAPPATTRPSTTTPSTTVPSTQPSTTQPSTTQPSTTQPSTTTPSTTSSSTPSGTTAPTLLPGVVLPSVSALPLPTGSNDSNDSTTSTPAASPTSTSSPSSSSEASDTAGTSESAASSSSAGSSATSPTGSSTPDREARSTPRRAALLEALGGARTGRS